MPGLLWRGSVKAGVRSGSKKVADWMQTTVPDVAADVGMPLAPWRCIEHDGNVPPCLCCMRRHQNPRDPATAFLAGLCHTGIRIMQGNQGSIEYLDRTPRNELTAVYQFWLHYGLQEDWGLAGMANKGREESLEEMQHADKIITQIICLEGHRGLQTLEPLRIGRSPKEAQENDLAAEYDTHALYKEARRYCRGVGDYVFMALFEELLADEEGQIDFLDTQIDLHDRIGAENFEKLNASKMDEVK